MTDIERCKSLIRSYIEDEFDSTEEFKDLWEIGIAYCQFQSEYGEASNLDEAEEQWIVNLERCRVECCIDGEAQICYTFNDLDELADWLEENLEFEWLIGEADEWCREHEAITGVN